MSEIATPEMRVYLLILLASAAHAVALPFLRPRAAPAVVRAGVRTPLLVCSADSVLTASGPESSGPGFQWTPLFVVKVGALAFILFLPTQYALDLQLLGGLWIVQTLPALVFGLFTVWFRAEGLLLGWAVGIGAGASRAVHDPAAGGHGGAWRRLTDACRHRRILR